jgi:hypothetical protein
MKLKVTKAIKGLVPGDILNYNEKDDVYEIYKVDVDISENEEVKKTLKVSIASYLVDDFKDNFAYVDEDGNTITVEEFRWQDSPRVGTEVSTIDKQIEEINGLKKKIEELEKEVEGYKQPKVDGYSIPYIAFQPMYGRRSFWNF